MVPVPTRIPGSATVGEAIDLIRAHDHGGLPVVDGDRLVGFVSPIHLLRQPLYRAVAEVMATDLTPASPDLPIGQAYDLLTRQRADLLPVVEGDRLVGLVTLAAVLEARSQERDPLTGLPWAPTLRNWAMRALERGREVAILFIDLDNFRIINKALGHTVGDDIIRSVAYLLSNQVDPATDLLCRYAGDEFAVATTRRSEDARALALGLRDAVDLPVAVPGSAARVTVAIGFAGGRRVERRSASHIASTVEDLLTLASRGSTLAKESGRGIVHYSRREEDGAARDGGGEERSDEVRLRLEQARVHRDARGSTAEVELSLRGRAVRGSASARILGGGAPFLVADATLRAITQAVGESPGYLIDDLTLTPAEPDTVAVAVLTSDADPSERLVGSASATDPHVAVARAILSALNRRLGKALAAVP